MNLALPTLPICNTSTCTCTTYGSTCTHSCKRQRKTCLIESSIFFFLMAIAIKGFKVVKLLKLSRTSIEVYRETVNGTYIDCVHGVYVYNSYLRTPVLPFFK